MPKAKYTKRKDGRYLTHVDGGHREDGSRIRITVSARTISELEEKIRQKKNPEITRGFISGAPPGTRTLGPLIKSQLLYHLS